MSSSFARVSGQQRIVVRDGSLQQSTQAFAKQQAADGNGGGLSPINLALPRLMCPAVRAP